MTCRGQIRDSTIVLEKPTGLPDGAQVEVDIKPLAAPKVGRQSIEKLSEGIKFDFDAVAKLREASKL